MQASAGADLPVVWVTWKPPPDLGGLSYEVWLMLEPQATSEVWGDTRMLAVEGTKKEGQADTACMYGLAHITSALGRLYAQHLGAAGEAACIRALVLAQVRCVSRSWHHHHESGLHCLPCPPSCSPSCSATCRAQASAVPLQGCCILLPLMRPASCCHTIAPACAIGTPGHTEVSGRSCTALTA